MKKNRDFENKVDTLILACQVMKENHELLLSIDSIGKVMSRELTY